MMKNALLTQSLVALGLVLFSPAQIHPVLVDHCTKCHGGVKQKGGLDLRTIESAIEGGDFDTALVPGKPEKSPLFQAVQVGSDPHMPPKKQLAPEEITALGDWINHLKIIPPEPLVLPEPDLEPSLVIADLISSRWQEKSVTAAAPSEEATFVRRVYLDLLGRIPRASETRAFLSDDDPQKRSQLIDVLTTSPEHADHLAEIFKVVFLDRASSRKRNPDQRRPFLDYLRRSFHANRPWDQMARDLVIARPESDEARGASWFLYEQRDDHNEMAKRVSRTLLGKQVQCAQCHDHPVAPEIEQGHYWGLVAFFNRSLNVKTPEGPRVAERASGGYDQFANLEGKTDQSRLVLYSDEAIPEVGGPQTSEAPELYEVAPPDQWLRKLKKDEKLKTDLDRLPVPKFSRREALAQALTTDHPDFARAIVNRIWALLMGRGLVHPVDLMDSAHPASHPELLAWLARDFADHGHDLRRLIRAIARSRVYQLDSRPPLSAGRPPQESLFARALERPLSAEALARSLRVALDYPATNDEKLRLRFAKVFPDLFAETFSPSVQQTMFLTNGPLIDQLVRESPLVARLSNIEKQPVLVSEIFQVILSREPDASEADRARSFLKPGDPSSIRQFCWALLTSAEFRLNH